MVSAFGTIPVMSGRSGSPPRKDTITSAPTRGIALMPKFAPAHGVATRIQAELRASSRTVKIR